MMERPATVIETTATTVWFDGTVLCIRSKGVPSTAATVGETFAAVSRLIGAAPRPTLFDAREWPEGDPEAWRVVISRLESAFSRVAVLIDPGVADRAGMRGFQMIIDRLLVPFQLFTDEAAALAFLVGEGGISQPGTPSV